MERAEAAADKAIVSLKKPVTVAEEAIAIAVSAGIASAGGARGEVSEIVRRADLALSYARQSGLNAWRLYDRSLDISLADARTRRTSG